MKHSKKVMSLGNVGLILLSALPIRGFGILSASIVSFFLKKGRVEGTILLMTAPSSVFSLSWELQAES